MKRTFATISTTIALALVTVALMMSQNGAKAGRTAVVMHYETTDKLGNVTHEVVSYRADGSTARSASFNGAPAQVEVIDLASKRSFVKDPVTKLYDEVPLTVETAERYAHTPTTCESATSKQYKCDPVEEGRILGQRIQRATGKLGDSNVTTIYAPDLDYNELLRTRTSADGTVTFNRKVTAIIRDAAVEEAFSLPADYRKVAKPSDFIGAGQVARGKTDPGAGDPTNRDTFDKAQLDKRALDAKSRVN